MRAEEVGLVPEFDGKEVEVLCDCGATVLAKIVGPDCAVLVWHCPHCSRDFVEPND